MNGLNSFDKTDSEYSPLMTWLDSGGQRTKVTAGQRGQILWTPGFIIYLSSLDESYRE